ncbi:MAG: diguanylate cyclase domain-containing protein [Gaiellaceae bacterium]
MSLAIVIGSLAVASLTVLVAVAAVGRARRRAEARLVEAVQRLADGMEDTMRELADAVSEAQAAARQASFGGGVTELDFDDVTEHALQAVAAVPGVESALLETLGPSGRVISSAVGLSSEEAGVTDIEMPADEGLRAVEVAYGFHSDDPPNAALRSGVVVPLRIAGSRVGTLSAFSRTSSEQFDPSTLDEIEQLAGRATPALWNARRFTEARDLADLDPLTRLHNRRYFQELLAREVARAHRYRRRLSLLVVDVDDFTELNARIGRHGAETILVELARQLRLVVRTADIPCRTGEDEFAVILPESEAGGAELLAKRVARAVAARPADDDGSAVRVSVGVSDLRPGDNESDLVRRAEDALARAKGAGAVSQPAAAI